MALFTDSSAITLYILLGWGIPLGCVVMWAGLKAGLDDTHCWTVNTVPWVFWVCIRAPVAVSNLINFFFFLNVVRVLVLKLRSSISAESMKYRKLGKSTLVLVPLFGVHYFVLWGLSTSNNEYVELVWLLLDQVFASFQGFFVAVLYCLMNGEVRQELRKLYNRWYKGDPLVFNSHSTLISHTKTYASRGRASLPSIHSQAERRERQTPSPQMPRCGGSGEMGSTTNNIHTNNASPSPTKTLTPTYGTRYQSRDMSSCLGSSEWCTEEAIELQPCTLSDSSQSSSRPSPQPDPRYSPPRLRPTPAVSPSPSPHPPSCTEGPPVEILIDLHEDGVERTDGDGSVRHPPNTQDHASRTKEKHLKFSESTDQFQMAKLSPTKVNGAAVVCEPGNTDDNNSSRGVICVNVNKNSLKSSIPVQIDSHILKNSKGKEHETML
ncbi:hypothetical protein Pcinc_035556 [Petrolisthes cinctipes]|uniref:G-protein coupled receptors family 2 profile 2 domain-containing protein n=1 Tax=Petrolisthes cinctipes TaxID=88211 RepID=A0AAE1BWC8_PETCI|nr:hypothetical protein Pcinc_035556 [Petrolisthes cinctipes]